MLPFGIGIVVYPLVLIISAIFGSFPAGADNQTKCATYLFPEDTFVYHPMHRLPLVSNRKASTLKVDLDPDEIPETLSFTVRSPRGQVLAHGYKHISHGVLRQGFVRKHDSDIPNSSILSTLYTELHDKLPDDSEILVKSSNPANNQAWHIWLNFWQQHRSPNLSSDVEFTDLTQRLTRWSRQNARTIPWIELLQRAGWTHFKVFPADPLDPSSDFYILLRKGNDDFLFPPKEAHKEITRSVARLTGQNFPLESPEEREITLAEARTHIEQSDGLSSTYLRKWQSSAIRPHDTYETHVVDYAGKSLRTVEALSPEEATGQEFRGAFFYSQFINSQAGEDVLYLPRVAGRDLPGFDGAILAADTGESKANLSLKSARFAEDAGSQEAESLLSTIDTAIAKARRFSDINAWLNVLVGVSEDQPRVVKPGNRSGENYHFSIAWTKSMTQLLGVGDLGQATQQPRPTRIVVEISGSTNEEYRTCPVDLITWSGHHLFEPLAQKLKDNSPWIEEISLVSEKDVITLKHRDGKILAESFTLSSGRYRTSGSRWL